MKIQPQAYTPPSLKQLPKGPAPQAPVDGFDRNANQEGYTNIAKSMAWGAGIGTVAGAASHFLPILQGVPTGLATGLTTSAGLVAGAFLGLAVGYAREASR